MDVNPAATNSIMQTVSGATEPSTATAAIRQQQQGFFQVSPTGDMLTGNTYNANGERQKVPVAAANEPVFNRTF